jgi:hypothetical protein
VGVGPHTPNPKPPIPNPQSPIPIAKIKKYEKIYLFKIISKLHQKISVIKKN